MDLTKFFLYTALAIVTYLMLLAWQEDYPPLVDDGSTPVVIPDTPPLAETPQAAPVDLPQQVSDSPAPQDTAPVQQEPLVAGQSISVSTDTLQLTINLDGGDIVALSLPQYLKQLDVTSDPFEILESDSGRQYIAQSGLIGQDGIDSNGRASYQAQASSYQLENNENTLQVDLVHQAGDGVVITKRFGFTRDSYLIDISYIVDNQSGQEWQANPFGRIIRDSFDDPSDAGGFGRTYLGFVTTNQEDPYIEVEFEDIDEGTSTFDTQGGWIGFSQHYFISAFIPDPESTNRYTTRRFNNQYYGEFGSTPLVVGPGETGRTTVKFYAGPKDQYVLGDISPNLNLTIDYSFLYFIASPIYWLLTRINSFIGNYGVSIILLTVLVKALLYKLSETQYKSMAGMRRLMPKMQQLKESYGDDKMKLQQATMELYKKEKINPFGGCLPMLVQMPVFIALYWVLMESVELRHAPFFLWLNDLSVRDPFFILPLLMGGTMFAQTMLSPAPADPMQAQVMKIMPVMMTVLFLWFPAGLVLYWLTNGALGILQQWYITRKIEAEYEAKKAAQN